MNRKTTTLLALSLAPWLPGAGCTTAVPPPPQPPPRVTVGHPEERELVDDDEYAGWLEAARTVEVRARVRGHIQKIDFTDGQIVTAGQLLFQLDPRPFETAIENARQTLKVYQAQKVAAEREYARLASLLERGGASQRQVDKAEADVGSLDAQIGAAMADIDSRTLDLEYSRITAPIDGRVGRAMLTEGNLVNAGGSDPLLTTIVSIDPIYAYFDVDERSLQRYQKLAVGGTPGRPTSLKEARLPFQFGLDSDEGYPREGILDFADNRVDTATGTIQLRGTIENAGAALVPGSRVRVRIPIGKPHRALLVPDTALLTDQDRKYVLLVGADNVVERRDVTPGTLLDDGMRVVLPGRGQAPGLTTADRIVVEGLQRARLHYPVDPVTPQDVPAAGGAGP